MVSFTGSGPVGATIQEAVPHKHVTLELGGNAAAVVLGDYRSTSRPGLGRHPDRGLRQLPGRPVLHLGAAGDRRRAPVYDRLVAKIVAAVEAQRTGDPADTGTDVGPLINEAAARARRGLGGRGGGRRGATLLDRRRPRRRGAMPRPCWPTHPPRRRSSARRSSGRCWSCSAVDGVDEAFAQVNASQFGLQAGVFTHDLQAAFRAHRELEVGGVIVGDAPSYRADQMPYGGVKASGVGREGVKYAMEDYTYERVLVLTGIEL